MLTSNILLQNRYLVLRPIGRGGMGTVYEATDTRLNATVALKETQMTDNASRRAFEREAQLLARLRHPVLPKVIDHFAEEEGQFLVMEFIPGDDLSTLMEKQPGGRFPISAVLPWMLRWGDQLLDALDYLHRQTPPIYHRDIKPQNLKLTARGDIILLDFGLAKGGMAEASTVTARGEKLLGFTPNYAPLEQIRGGDPDARSDLYSLAATLYHLVVGHPPPDALTRVAALLNDQPDPIPPTNEQNTYVTAAVAGVLHTALSPNLDDRYSSAAEMRKALYEARHSREATSAPRSASSVSILKPDQESVSIPRRVSDALVMTHRENHTVTRPGDTTTTRQLRTEELEGETNPPGTMLRAFQIGYPVLCLALSPDERLLAVGGDDHVIGLWDIQEGEQICSLEGHTRGISSLAFSPDGRLLLSGSEDNSLCLWNVRDASMIEQKEHSEPIECVAISPDGQWIAFGGWSDVVFICQIQDDAIVDYTELSASFVHSLAFSADSCMLTAGCYDSTVRVWRMSDRQPLHTLSGHSNFVLTTAFHPGGKTLVSGGGETDVRLWRLRDGRMLDVFKGHTNFVRSVAFSPNGQIIASASEDKTVRLWQANDGTPLHTMEGHTDGVTSVLFGSEGRILISGSRDNKVRIWQAE